MNSALQICQERHDNQTPAEPSDPWIETPSGQEWLERSIQELLLGRDVVIRYANPRIAVTARAFIARFAEEATEIYANDSTYSMEWFLIRGYRPDPDPYPALSRAIATRMLMPHAATVEEIERSCPF